MVSNVSFKWTVTILLVIVLFLFVDLPESLFLNAIQNSGHGIIFCLLTICIYGTRLRNNKQIFGIRNIYDGILLFLFGITLEALQFLIGRGASAYDVMNNSLGIVSGFLFCVAFTLYKHHTLILRKCILLILVGVLATFAYMYQPIKLILSVYLRPALPLLIDFENIGSTSIIETSNSSIIVENQAVQWNENETNVLKVKFYKGRNASIRFNGFSSDWSGYTHLAYDVYNLGTDTLTLKTRIDFRHVVESTIQRHYWNHQLEPGTNNLKIDLIQGLEYKNIQNESVLLSNFSIKTFYVFLSRLDSNKQILIDEFRLYSNPRE